VYGRGRKHHTGSVTSKHPLPGGGGTPAYAPGPQYNGEGAAAFIFERWATDPNYLFRGAGRVAGELRVYQYPQIEYQLVVPVAGIGGLVAGQIFGQPLVNMEPVKE
jgi:hypothetical protein